ncbi:sensor histidine kinase [Pontibacter chinhatensis]|uniref:histidine kinase n=1 Tax=Pontibacter chinhatensis TaxID=1436961 RepID=A0A1I2P0R4_9BACT|nr:sensor histidine kinase [Pontibacter chinhatensis]SFG09634.1 Histidine kinase-like ATPase domain-containing protein [Pontibacter chinhatensis]
MPQYILKIEINNELDVVLAYKRAMQLSERLGMQQANQTKFATAVSEICRNVVEYVGSGSIQYSLAEVAGRRYLEALVSDRGRGIGNLDDILKRTDLVSYNNRGTGILNSRKLVDLFEIESDFERGTRVRLAKSLPQSSPAIGREMLKHWIQEFEHEAVISPYAEIKRQNMQLLEVLEQLRMRNLEAEQQLQEIRRLNTQLQQSNQEINKLLEDREKQNLKLQDINQNLDAFAHTVSHDLRAPLQNINGISTALEACLEAGQLEEAAYVFPMLRQQTQKMDRLITSILAYSLAGHGNLPKKALDLQVLLHQVVASLNVPATFRIEIQENLPVLYTQEIYLYQVFSNLISNAIKYHDQPEQALLQISYELKPDFLYFTVEDNGPGIPAERHRQLFNMYELGHSFPRENSSGLGLSIVRKLVEEKGGSIWLDSSGRGSRFTFTWPTYELILEE